MHVDIKTTNIKPVRQAFGHLVRRFGDKAATRYQEATYDLQPDTNFHYKPLWDPEHDIYDRGRTELVMRDWHDLKDPRQFYYGTYTMTRAKWQEALDQQLEFVEKRDLLRALPLSVQETIVFAMVPLRHYEWGANTNNCHMTAYGWGAAITQATMMNTMDRLGMAQHLSRIGLLIDGNAGTSLETARRCWLIAPEWQGLRREVETMFVTRDWFELFVAQNLVADSLVYPLFFQHLDAQIARDHGASLSLLTQYLMRWYHETSRWVDAVVMAASSESEANRSLLRGWTARWRVSLAEAIAPLADRLMEPRGEAWAAVLAGLDARASRLGVL
jgi:phenol hydroxylase P1 protein